MKKILFKIFVLLFILTSCASELRIAFADVPQAVVNSFNQKYPGAKITGWEIEKEKNKPMVFEVSFLHNGKKSSAEFKPDGTFVEEE